MSKLENSDCFICGEKDINCHCEYEAYEASQKLGKERDKYRKALEEIVAHDASQLVGSNIHWVDIAKGALRYE